MVYCNHQQLSMLSQTYQDTEGLVQEPTFYGSFFQLWSRRAQWVEIPSGKNPRTASVYDVQSSLAYLSQPVNPEPSAYQAGSLPPYYGSFPLISFYPYLVFSPRQNNALLMPVKHYFAFTRRQEDGENIKEDAWELHNKKDV